jgi:hypothetical protein
MHIEAPSITIIGNIASGKSTLARGIHAAWPQLNYACVDTVRVALRDRFPKREQAYALEHAAAEILMKQVMEASPLLYESSGATRLYAKASAHIRAYRKGAATTIRTRCGQALAMRRHTARKAAGHKQVPPPFRGALAIPDCWYRFEDMLRGPVVDLVIDTEKHGPEETLAMALDHIRERIPQFPTAA